MPASEGAKALAEALKGQSRPQSALQKLHLCESNISDAGAKAWAAALKVDLALQELRLDYNKRSDEGAKALAQALPRATLRQQPAGGTGTNFGVDGITCSPSFSRHRRP